MYMLIALKKTIHSLLDRVCWGRRWLRVRGIQSYLTGRGWMRSVSRGIPVTDGDEPIPWYTYPFIDFVGQRVRPDMRVFEYGSGNSTLWWSQRVAGVDACEHDREWLDRFSESVPPNVDYHYSELVRGGEYSKRILSFTDTFDCIVIDGRDRVNCAKNALQALKDNGVIIWDNSDRSSYEEGYDYLRKHGFRRIDFWGLGPINDSEWCTSLFYRKDNCFEV